MKTALSALALAAGLTLSLPVLAESRTSYGPQLEGFSYPHPLKHYRFESQGKPMQMAYMDVAPTGQANGRTALLLHGKNFCGATWERTIEVLSEAGYRVIAPDQVGFCSSSKPEGYQFSFAQLAHNTQALLQQEGIDQVSVIGHSMGGMLAARLALNYPQLAEQRSHVGKFYFRPPGGESWCDVILRLRGVLDTMVREYRRERVLIVAHQVIVNCLRYLMERMDEQRILDIDRAGDVPNCGVTSYLFDAAAGRHGKLLPHHINFVAPLIEEGTPVTVEPDVPAAPKS